MALTWNYFSHYRRAYLVWVVCCKVVCHCLGGGWFMPTLHFDSSPSLSLSTELKYISSTFNLSETFTCTQLNFTVSGCKQTYTLSLVANIKSEFTLAYSCSRPTQMWWHQKPAAQPPNNKRVWEQTTKKVFSWQPLFSTTQFVFVMWLFTLCMHYWITKLLLPPDPFFFNNAYISSMWLTTHRIYYVIGHLWLVS